MPGRSRAYLNEVFSPKNLSDLTNDDIIFSSPKSIKMDMLNHHLHETREHWLLHKKLGTKTKDKNLKLTSRYFPVVVTHTFSQTSFYFPPFQKHDHLDLTFAGLPVIWPLHADNSGRQPRTQAVCKAPTPSDTLPEHGPVAQP
jgi:hypothetical protein